MNEKLEIAKLATELTTASLQSRDITHALMLELRLTKLPAPIAIFDAIYDHLLTKLTPQ